MDRNPPQFPALPAEGLDISSFQAAVERHLFAEALKRAGGVDSKAASLLNLNHHTFR